MAQLFEKYRPQTWEAVLGQEAVIRRIRAVIGRPDFDRDAFWLWGKSGQGKTTIARLIAKELNAKVIEINGNRCNEHKVREIEAEIEPSPLFGNRQRWLVYIIDEAHNMKPSAIQEWLTVLESGFADHTLILFTSTKPVYVSKQESLFGDEGHPFDRRVKTFKLNDQGIAAAVVPWLRNVAIAEGLDGKPEKAYDELFRQCRSSIGLALQKIESGEMVS